MSNKKTCECCGVDKPVSQFLKRGYEVYNGTCKRCVRTNGAQTKYRHEMAGYICEAYVNNPNLSEGQLAAIFNTTRFTVGRVLSLYFGDGNPVYMSISCDE